MWLRILNTVIHCCRPEYAPESSDEDEEAVEFSLPKQQQFAKQSADSTYENRDEMGKDDRRLRRLQERQFDDVDSDEDRDRRFVEQFLHRV